MQRNQIAGALAITAASSLAIFAGSASATSSVTTLACDKATVTFTTFGPPPQALAHYELTVDGAPFTSPGPILRNGLPVVVAPGTLTPAGPLTVFEIPLNLQGTHVVAAVVHGTATNAFSTAGPLSVNCPLPAPPPAIVPPPVTPPSVTPPPEPPVRIVTCADLRAKGAGRKWLVQYGCVRKVERLTCADLKARGAGLRSLIARHCALPKPPPREWEVTG